MTGRGPKFVGSRRRLAPNASVFVRIHAQIFRPREQTIMDPAALQAMQAGGGMPTQQQVQQEQQKAEQQAEMRNGLLDKILTVDARERIKTIAITKPEKGQQIENMVLGMAQNGQVKTQITDAQLKQLLEGMQEANPKSSTIQFDRRRFGDDSDSEVSLDGL